METITHTLAEQFLPHIIELVVSGILLAVSPYIRQIFKNLHDRNHASTQDEKRQRIFDAILDATESRVEAVDATIVKSAKEAAGSGKVPKEAAKDALATALQGIKNDVGPSYIADLVKILGSQAAVDDHIKAQIENEVAKRKIQAPSGRTIVEVDPQDA